MNEQKIRTKKIKCYLLILSVLFFFIQSCSNNAQEKHEKRTHQAEKKFNKFSASGNEPGWSLDIIHSESEMKYQMVLDYGEVQFSGSAKALQHKSNDISEFILYHKGDSISIHLLDKACTDMAGFPHDLDVYFFYKDYKYIGCGDFDKVQLKESEAQLIQKLNHYICFENDENISPRIWISFNSKEFALQVKYEGQNNAIDLKFIKEEYREGGAHPTVIKYYDEILDGDLNGSYKITHSGIWDYVLYKRKRDGKEFHFTIDHEANPYGKIPCF